MYCYQCSYGCCDSFRKCLAKYNDYCYYYGQTVEYYSDSLAVGGIVAFVIGSLVFISIIIMIICCCCKRNSQTAYMNNQTITGQNPNSTTIIYSGMDPNQAAYGLIQPQSQPNNNINNQLNYDHNQQMNYYPNPNTLQPQHYYQNNAPFYQPQPNSFSQNGLNQPFYYQNPPESANMMIRS